MAAPAAEVAGVIVAFAFMALCNYLAMKKVFGSKDNKEISDEHPTYVSPDGPTFAIWGIIYMLELVMVVAQAFTSEGAEQMFAKLGPFGWDVRQRLMIAFVLNGVWLMFFNNERFWAALAIMFLYLGYLGSICQDLNVDATRSWLEAITLTAGISMNFSWIVVAFLVSVFFCAGTAGWKDDFNVAGSVPVASAAVVLVAAAGCWIATVKHDLAFAFAAAWACRGIFRMQTVPDEERFPVVALSPTLGEVARYCSLAVAAAMVISVVSMAYARIASVKAD